jgi:hypothetical protein
MQRTSNTKWTRARLFARASTAVTVLGGLFAIGTGAQTAQPYVFAGTVTNNQYGLMTIQRDDVMGTLTMLVNTNATLLNPCFPSEVDARGRFLFGVCGDGLSMYTLDPTSGAVAELATSPFAVSTGNSGILVVAESTGQYVYLLKAILPGTPTINSLILDIFQIDASTPALIPVGSQSIGVAGEFMGAVKDPLHHGIAVYLNQAAAGSSYPAAVLYTIQFNAVSGQVILDPSGGVSNDSGAKTIAISPTGNYLATGSGPVNGNLNIYQVAQGSFSLTNVGSVEIGAELNTYNFPDSIFFNSNGELIYAQGPPTNATGSGLPFYIYESATTLQIPSSPLAIADANFLNATLDPQGPFRYAPASGGGIQVYQIDSVTGLVDANSQLQTPFIPGVNFAYLFAPLGPSGGQGIVGPAIAQNTLALSFGTTAAGQSSGALPVTLSSSGDQPVTFSSIMINGANASDFKEGDTCLAPPVLVPNHSCVISVTYTPSAPGASQATLVISDNAPGSPQLVALAGTGVAGPTPAPVASIGSPGTFPPSGAITQGTSGTPQNVSLSNTGNAPLHVTNVALNGLNANDFVVGNTNCIGTLAAGASCTIPITFSPQAAGVRTTSLLVTDDAANSPQSVTLTGNAAAAVTIQAAAGGSTSATVSAGQTAQFNLQARGGAGFSGTLSFVCTGAPFGAVCSAPSSVTVSNGSTASFTVSIATTSAGSTAAASMEGRAFHVERLAPIFGFAALAGFFAFLLGLWGKVLGVSDLPSRRSGHAATAVFLTALVASGIGCSGGGSMQTTTQQQPQEQAAATPAIQPASGTYSAAQSVVISDSASGATIHYTIDGSNATTSSPTYSGPIVVGSATTVQAVAMVSGQANSAMATATYKFATPSGTFTLIVTPTATVAGSGKTLQLTPIGLTLTVK